MRWKIGLGCLLAVALLFVAGFAALYLARGESAWAEIGAVEELREQFNRDVDSTRIVLLLSPT